MNLDMPTYLKAARSIPIIEARLMIQQLKVASYPHAESKSRSETHKSFYDQAYPNQESKIIKTTDVLKALK